MNPGNRQWLSWRYTHPRLWCWLVFAGLQLAAVVIEPWLAGHSQTAAQVWLLLAGWCSWTLVEYILHRFYLHAGAQKESRLLREHLHHHEQPGNMSTSMRMRLLLLCVVWVMVILSTWMHNYFTFITGFVLGIYSYFTLHWVLHQPWSAWVFRKQFRYHFFHHWKYPDRCFGICVPWWDDLFETAPPNKAKVAPRKLAYFLKHHINEQSGVA